jgi:hypothetical protein
LGPFSREKGRGEVRGLKKKEVEEFVFVFFPDLKGGAIAKEKEGSASAFRCFRVFSFSLFNTSHTRCSARCEARKRKGGTQKAGAWRTKAFPFLLFFHQAKNRDKNDARLTFKTSCSNVDSSTSSTARTARPAERADAAEWAGLRAAGKAVELRLTRWEGRARPNVAVADDEEHRAEDSDAEIVALEAGLAVAARPVAVAFIDAIIVGAVARP